MNNLSIDSQIQELDEWMKINPAPRELKRTLAVKLALSCWAIRAIASLLNTSNSFISKWKKQFKELGIALIVSIRYGAGIFSASTFDFSTDEDVPISCIVENS